MPTLTINNTPYTYDGLGNPANPTLILAHTLIWDRHIFSRIAKELSGEFHIINLDQYGHGESGHRGLLSVQEVAGDYATLLDTLELDSVHWVGISMGALLGMHLTLTHPEKIHSLTLMSATSSAETEASNRGNLALADAFRAGQVVQVMDIMIPRLFGATTLREQPHLAAELRARAINQAKREGIYQMGLAVFHRPEITTDLARITIPTLVMVGEEDLNTPPIHSQVIAEHIPGAQLKLIPESGHMLAVEKPEAMVQELRSFLQPSR